MDIITGISDLLYEDAMDLCGQDPTYIELSRLQGRILNKIEAQGGEELVSKLLDAMEERTAYERLNYFFHGLRLGAELLRF